MNPKVSIIVPIYNMEKYLAKCFNSLLAQTLKEIEIIAVNDGSTDDSMLILKAYEEKESRIKIIDQSNQGVSAARNNGILHAKGDYIGFVDPDDWIAENMYHEMFHRATTYDADIVMCSYKSEYVHHAKEKVFPFPNEVYWEKEGIQKNILRRLIGPLEEEVAKPDFLDALGPVWSKLYKKKLITDHHLSFRDLREIGTNEDGLFNIAAFYYAKSCYFSNDPFYHYWKGNVESITTNYKPDLHDKWSILHNEMFTFIKQHQLEDHYIQALHNRICLGTLGLGLNTINKKGSPLVKMKILKAIVNDQQIRQSFQEFELSYLPFTWKAFYFCPKNKLLLGYYSFLLLIEFLRKRIK